MPELPEVETTRLGIAPWIEGRRVAALEIRERRLRWPIPRRIAAGLGGTLIHRIDRRGKYLLLRAERGTALLHLGMSGSLRVLHERTAPGKHEHFDIVLDSGACVRFRDPRRFGALLWTAQDPALHRLLRRLGPEPLDPGFDAAYLWQRARGRRVSIKTFLMNAEVVVGVGNIYASEALFRAGIGPRRPAGRVSHADMVKLVQAIRDVLGESIRRGGTTLQDFHGSNGEPGYFAHELRVYERAGNPCPVCTTPIRRITQGQRSTYFCPHCQK